MNDSWSSWERYREWLLQAFQEYENETKRTLFRKDSVCRWTRIDGGWRRKWMNKFMIEIERVKP